MTESRELACLTARIASSKQAEVIMVLDVRDLITITDYFVITSGSSDRQVDTIAEEIVKTLKKQGSGPVRREGDAGSGWILLDFVDFVVHVFGEEEREYYRLETLWADAPVVDWEEEAKVSSG